MPTPLTWTSLQTELVIALEQSYTPYTVIPADFAALYPSAIAYAEQRICSEIPLLANRTQNTQLVTTAGNRQINLSSMTSPLVVMERLALITPASTTPINGTRYQYIKTTLDVIDSFWPEESLTMAPSAADWIGRWWAPINTGGTGAAYSGSTSLIAIAPTPDGTYIAECTGLFQPTPLSGTNTSTYLSTVYPQLLFAACMIFLEGALIRNFGMAGVDPKEGLNWEQQYRTLKEACEFEEARRRGLAPDVPRGPQPAQAA